MNSPSRSDRLKRLAQADWRFQDRQRGYTTYRNGRPYTRSRKGAPAIEQLVTATLLMLTVVIAFIAVGVR